MAQIPDPDSCCTDSLLAWGNPTCAQKKPQKTYNNKKAKTKIQTKRRKNKAKQKRTQNNSKNPANLS